MNSLGLGCGASGAVALNPRPAGGEGQPVALASARPVPTTDPRQRLAGFVRAQFDENVRDRTAAGVDGKLLRAMEMGRGEYSAEECARFEGMGIPKELYLPLADTKMRAALAQLKEIFSAPGDKPWTLRRSPWPSVPPQVVAEGFARVIRELLAICQATGRVPSPQDARDFAVRRMDDIIHMAEEWADRRVERMEKKVHDQMVEGGMIEAFNDYTNYVCRYGTALMIGPVPCVRHRTVLADSRLGVPRYARKPKRILAFDAVSPWDCFPQKGARAASEGNLCVRVRFTSAELHACTIGGVARGSVREDGQWYADTVDAILARFPSGGAAGEDVPSDGRRRMLENESAGSGRSGMVEGIRMFGDVRGETLRSFGMLKTADGRTLDPGRYYEADVITVQDFVVYCKVLDPRVGRPVVKGVFYEMPGSWWGDSIADKLAATQKMANLSLRNLATNTSMCSGSMLYVKDAHRLMNSGADALTVEPWKVWAFKSGVYGQGDVPIGTLSVESRIAEILEILKWAKIQADEDTGIPAYTYGMNVSGGAGRTASGLAMLTEAASRGMKMVIGATDRDVIRGLVKMCVAHNMLDDPDVSIKGDCEVNPSGVMGMILREQESQRRRSLLGLIVNPAVLPAVGVRGIAALLREEVKNLGINPDDVVKGKEALDDIELLQRLQQVAGMERQMGGMGDGGGAAAGGPAGPPPFDAGGGGAAPAQRRAETVKADPVGAGMGRGGVRGRMGEA